uniref:RNAbinding protein putative n=1 Tax=Albugo laibachii Nc14 TaxID=890382 RepID=F0WRC6_9STRA|nr:RNAbinding protein putative [Albugo laibachii Nc14]|eukprot:CCA23889.1 RNAbinding protein putative [Albugo laibachii Nc14]
MDSEIKEQLREWLVRNLEPVCDADPEVLSKYVLALVQNDPLKDGLRQVCINKLEEFLGEETEEFVSRLFQAIKTGEYTLESMKGTSCEDGKEKPAENNSKKDKDRRRNRGAEDDGRYQKHRKYLAEHEYRSRPSDYHPRSAFGPSTHPNGARDDRNTHSMGSFSNRGRNLSSEWMPNPLMEMGPWGPPMVYQQAPRGSSYPRHHGFEYNPELSGIIPRSGSMGMPMHPRYSRMPQPYYNGRARNIRGNAPGRHRTLEDAANGHGKEGESNTGSSTHGSSGATTTLRVSNIDSKYVNMTKLSLHFSKFGNVVNVQMRPKFKCAYVQYATEEEARRAIHSPIPVCNNRFIEVKWAKYDAKAPDGAPEDENQADQIDAEHSDKTDGNTKDDEKALFTEELRAAALEKGRKVLEEKRELLEKQKLLMKQKKDLIKRQLAQQKEILETMTRNGTSNLIQDKNELLNKILALSEELKALQSGQPSSVAPTNSGRLEGLKAELRSLEAQASAGSLSKAEGSHQSVHSNDRNATSNRYRGGRNPGRGRSKFHIQSSHTLDNRTTILKVEKLPEEARDGSVLEQHFGNFGAIEKVVVDPSQPECAYIKFQDRHSAQIALLRGKSYGSSTLEMNWTERNDAPIELHAKGNAVDDEGT